jgi:hypothetical protein
VTATQGAFHSFLLTGQFECVAANQSGRVAQYRLEPLANYERLRNVGVSGIQIGLCKPNKPSSSGNVGFPRTTVDDHRWLAAKVFGNEEGVTIVGECRQACDSDAMNPTASSTAKGAEPTRRDRIQRNHWTLLSGALLCFVACGSPTAPEIPAGIEKQELQVATGHAAGQPQFRRIPVTESGLSFINRLRRENRYTYLTNGAGLLDAYMVSQDGQNQLFRQVAPLRFEDVTATAGNVDGGAAWGSGATFADVDGDGDLDLYVCNIESKNLLYENLGDGTFTENGKKFGLDLVAASTMAAFADYDRDGTLDLYLLTNRALHAGWTDTPEVLHGFRPPKDISKKPTELVPTEQQWQQLRELAARGKLTNGALSEDLHKHFFAFRGHIYTAGQPDRLLRNVAGRFIDVTSSAGIADHGMGLSATWCDYDGDGYPDLYVANDLETPDTLYHNERNGKFRDVTKEALPHTAYYGMGSDAADVDGDGFFDFLIADMSMTTHEKAKVLMGDMQEERPVLMHSEPPQVMRNALLLNNGMGKFQEAAKLAGVASTDWTWSVLFGDLDHDTRVDLFATNGIARFDTDPDLKLRVAELWREGRQQAAIALIQNVAAAPEKNVALRNTKDLVFENVGKDWGLDLEAVSHGAALADFDGDGDLDVLVHNFESPAALYENQTTAGKSIIVRLKGQRSERFGVGTRVVAQLPSGQRIVRELVLSRGYLSGQAPELHFGLGNAATVHISVYWPSGHVQQFENLETHARYVITESNKEPPRIDADTEANVQPTLFVPADTGESLSRYTHRENDFDEYVAQPLLPALVSRLGPALAASDEFVFVGGAKDQPGELHVNHGEFGLLPVEDLFRKDAASEDVGACLFDADGDGDTDLLVTSGGSEVASGHANLRDRFYRNHKGTLTRDDSAFPDIRESSGRAVVGDYDGDGDLDVFVAGRLVPGAYPDAPASRLYRNDNGTFTDVTAAIAGPLLTAGMVTDALFTDADGDGKIDLLVAAHWQPIRLLHNDGERFTDATEAAGLSKATGWWNCLTEWDVDGDGDLDYIAGNQGWNTKYKASPEKPARLYFGDFDEDGNRDLVEAKYEGDRLLPVRGRSCSSGAMPSIGKRFPTYEKFAGSLLKDIYTEEKLSTCGELAATQLASCILRNDGKGHFTIEPLPHRAQIAPINAMVVQKDLLVCAQNNFSPEPETGRHDGGTGLVLQAVEGKLTVLPPQAHGINLFGDMRALVATPDGTLIFAPNNAAVRAYRHR